MTKHNDSAIIEVRDLVKVYGDDTRALDGISFAVQPGELFGFLGPNGAGKTTTIRILRHGGAVDRDPGDHSPGRNPVGVQSGVPLTR